MNNRNDVSDLLAEADVGINSKRIVCCGESTLNTPYKDGLVSGSQGIAYINMANESYGTVMYIVCGGNEVFLKRKSGGTWDNNWQKLVTNADFAPLTYNDTSGDNIQDMIKAKAKIIAQNTSGNICGMLPGGWQGQQFGFTFFGKANNMITLMIVLQRDTYTADYNASNDTVSNIKKITTTSVG